MNVLSGGTIRTGERGIALIDACRNRQLTRSEVSLLVRDQGFPQLFAVLCLEFLGAGNS